MDWTKYSSPIEKKKTSDRDTFRFWKQKFFSIKLSLKKIIELSVSNTLSV